MDELRVTAGAPGGQSEYRTALTASALFKTFVASSVTLSELSPAGSPPPPVIAAAEASAGSSWLTAPKPPNWGTQRYPHASYPGLEVSDSPGITPEDGQGAMTEAAKAGGVRVVGESLPHKAGAMHVTGEAEHT